MATHNQTRHVGYLTHDPYVVDNGAGIVLKIRTLHRGNMEYPGPKFQNLLVYYNIHDELFDRMKSYNKYDVLDIKGVYNIMPVEKKQRCPECGHINGKFRGTQTFIFPISVIKLNSLLGCYSQDNDLPERVLYSLYEEVSNQAIIIGTVVSEPELLQVGKYPCCRYRLGVDRKYFIKTQDDVVSDYPWIYSYNDQAQSDHKYLKEGATILVDGFIRRHTMKTQCTCDDCKTAFEYKDALTEIIPYSIEYLAGHLTDAEIERFAEMEKQAAKNQIMNNM